MSPDPADLAAVDLTNPQSLNRYAYALNSPTSLIDPSGLGPFAPIDPGCIGEDDAGFPWDICTGLAGGVPLPIIPVIIGGGGGTGGSGGGTGGGGGGGGQNGDTGSTGSSPPSGCEQLPSGVWCPSGGGFPVWTIYAAGGGLFIAVYATITMQAPANPAPRHCLWCVLAHRPWMVSWVIPLVPLPELGVGPAGSVAYNPDTGTVCASFGLGAGAGHNLAFGPLTNGIVFNSTSPFPAGADQILRGVSTSFGGNAIPLGFQAVANGAGGAIGPTLGIPGYTLSVTVSGCAVAR